MVSGVLLPLFLRTVFSASTTAATFCASVFCRWGLCRSRCCPAYPAHPARKGRRARRLLKAAAPLQLQEPLPSIVSKALSVVPPLSSYGSALLPSFILSPAAGRCQWADAPNFAGKFRQSVQKQEHFKIASACTPTIFSGKIIFIRNSGKSADFPELLFTGHTARAFLHAKKAAAQPVCGSPRCIKLCSE